MEVLNGIKALGWWQTAVFVAKTEKFLLMIVLIIFHASGKSSR